MITAFVILVIAAWFLERALIRPWEKREEEMKQQFFDNKNHKS